MRFVFWQNIVSIHQSVFLRNLAEQHEVVLLVENTVTQDRIDQGWKAPDLGKVQIIQSPSKDLVVQLLKKYESDWHIFSGFNSIKTTYEAFKKASAVNLKIAIIAEPFRWFGFKGKIRYCKYLFFRLRYAGKIRFLLITSGKGIDWYRSVGFSDSRLFPWAYFTENITISAQTNFNHLASSKPDKLFVGQINHRKNIISLVKVCKLNKEYFGTFNIIGTGPLEDQLKMLIKDEIQIKFLGSLSNEIVHKYMQIADLLILPSIFDGWGAVVNEALQSGTAVITSENCGASDLLDGEIRGEMFTFSGANTLDIVLRKWLAKGKILPEHRTRIKQWSQVNLSGEAAAQYFMDIINFIENKTNIRPEAPWIKNKFE